MNDYHSLRIDIAPCNEDMTDYVASCLGDIGYESFVPDSTGLTAYVKAELFDKDAVDDIITDLPFECACTCSSDFIEGRDWNAEWEKNYFKPIVVGGECVVHSTFHTDVPKAKYDIVIDPKMAFGTGHHPTTSQMVSAIIGLDLTDATVIDMGTGTGILAILAAMRGASKVYGIEIDGFAYTNAIENIRLNNQSDIVLINGDASMLDGIAKCDVLLANINLNVILADLPRYADSLRDSGTMLLSGFYEKDIPQIADRCASCSLTILGHTTMGDDKWACVKLVKG